MQLEILGFHTFHLGFQDTKIRLVNANKTLFPVSRALHNLTNLLGLFLVCEGTDAIARDDVFENSQLRKEGELPDQWVVRDGIRVRGGRNLGKRERVQPSKKAQLSTGLMNGLTAYVAELTLFSGSATIS